MITKDECRINFHSINYSANIWLNGHLIADTSDIEGAYRLYNLNISPYAVAGEDNCLALEIFPPKGMDLTITWVDWNPTPPDRGMGIWYDVEVLLGRLPLNIKVITSSIFHGRTGGLTVSTGVQHLTKL
jgi:exo-1,4-beta-D-glucosaminidase